MKYEIEKSTEYLIVHDEKGNVIFESNPDHTEWTDNFIVEAVDALNSQDEKDKRITALEEGLRELLKFQPSLQVAGVHSDDALHNWVMAYDEARNLLLTNATPPTSITEPEEKCTRCKHFVPDDLDGLCELEMCGTRVLVNTPECKFEDTPPANGELRGKWKSGGCVIWTEYDPSCDGYKGNVDLTGLLMRNTPDELELAINDIVEAHNAVFTEEES